MIDNKIKGTTKVYGVIGNPIKHTFSPTIHNTLTEILGRDTIYIPIHVLDDDLQTAIKGAYALNIQGLNVTVPHKINVMKMCYKIDKAAIVIGAINTLKYTEKGYIGYNTDFIGAYYAIKNAGYEIKDKTILLLGAGGAAKACGVMAADKGCKKLYIANRTAEKAKDLAKRIKENYDCDAEGISNADIDKLPHIDYVINATTVGFGDKADLSPIENPNFFTEKGVELVFDVIYSPWETKLLKDAKEKGCNTINGFSMLIYQAVASAEIWFDESISTELQENLCEELGKFYRENNQ